MKIRSFKLVTGEEIVTEVLTVAQRLAEGNGVLSGSGNCVTVRRPHVLQFQPVSPGQLGLALIPWTLSNPGIQSLEIPHSAILVEFEPQNEVERQYIEQTSGIALST